MEEITKTIQQALVIGITFLIKLYRFLLSPLLGRNCRFHPTCSIYAEQAFKEHGILKGFYLTIWRILRCQPFASSGFDPVPTNKYKCRKI